jgi:hypothetical protein
VSQRSAIQSSASVNRDSPSIAIGVHGVSLNHGRIPFTCCCGLNHKGLQGHRQSRWIRILVCGWVAWILLGALFCCCLFLLLWVDVDLNVVVAQQSVGSMGYRWTQKRCKHTCSNIVTLPSLSLYLSLSLSLSLSLCVCVCVRVCVCVGGWVSLSPCLTPTLTQT